MNYYLILLRQGNEAFLEFLPRQKNMILNSQSQQDMMVRLLKLSKMNDCVDSFSRF